MIVVDVETTGFNPRRHAIISIGAVDFEQPQNQFYDECIIDAKTSVDPYALQINGFKTKDITDMSKSTLAEIARKFHEWTQPIRDKTLGGHNTAFDVGFLRAAFARAGFERFPLSFAHIDMHNIAYAHMLKHLKKAPLNKYEAFSVKADQVFEYVGLPAEPKPHHGLTGAKMEAEAMCRLIHGTGLLNEFKKYPIPSEFKLVVNSPGDEVKNPATTQD